MELMTRGWVNALHAPELVVFPYGRMNIKNQRVWGVLPRVLPGV
jgi:hypothetical protein